MAHKAHVADWKKDEVKAIADLMMSSEVVGVVNITNLPSLQFQKLRASLRGKVTLKVAKRRLIKLAIEKIKDKKKGVEQLEPYIDGIMPGLIFSEENPFALAKMLNKNKSAAPAKGGQEAPNDIWVRAGATPFNPGPIIGQLGALKIQTEIEGGKIHISEDCCVVKEGEVISADAANILSRLGIEPMEIGLDLRVTYENGEILTKDILFVDEAQYIADLSIAAGWAFNLAFNSAFPTVETVPLLLGTAHADARALAMSQDILTSETAVMLLAKAARQGAALESKIPEAPAPKAEPKKEEPKAEEPPKEEPKQEEPKAEEPKKEEKPKEEPKKEAKEESKEEKK